MPSYPACLSVFTCMSYTCCQSGAVIVVHALYGPVCTDYRLLGCWHWNVMKETNSKKMKALSQVPAAAAIGGGQCNCRRAEQE